VLTDPRDLDVRQRFAELLECGHAGCSLPILGRPAKRRRCYNCAFAVARPDFYDERPYGRAATEQALHLPGEISAVLWELADRALTTGAVALLLIGSLVGGHDDWDERSDLDLVAIGTAADDFLELEELLELEERLAREIQILDYTPEDFLGQLRSSQPFAHLALRSGLALHGQDYIQALGRRSDAEGWRLDVELSFELAQRLAGTAHLVAFLNRPVGVDETAVDSFVDDSSADDSFTDDVADEAARAIKAVARWRLLQEGIACSRRALPQRLRQCGEDELAALVARALDWPDDPQGFLDQALPFLDPYVSAAGREALALVGAAREVRARAGSGTSGCEGGNSCDPIGTGP
jgi:hypothetical protein